jgi:hypothetical protein
MTSIFNRCDNLDEITKLNNNMSPSLSQGMKFKQFQNKFINKSNKNNNYNHIYNDRYFVEGFEGSNTNIYLGKRLVFRNKTSDGGSSMISITAYVTDKGIIRPAKDLSGAPPSETNCNYNSLMWLPNDYPLNASPGTTIPELNLTIGEPMIRGKDKCEYQSPNENMNLSGKWVTFKYATFAYVTNEGIVRIFPYDDESTKRNGKFSEKLLDNGIIGVFLDIDYPFDSPLGTNIPIINLKTGEPLPEDYTFPSTNASASTSTSTSTNASTIATNEVVSSDNPTYTNDPSENKLATESNEIVDDNQETKEQELQLEQLRKDYDDSLKQYQDLMNKINEKNQDYLKRTSNNPYLGKTIKFTGGQVCYVTNQGVVKYIPDPSIWDSITGKNGCPNKTLTDVSIKYPDTDVPGTSIPELNLILGPHMQLNESCSNAGKNVYVNTLLNNPKEKYIGCYNDKQPTADILFVPVMNSSNNVSGFKSYASSMYQNNNAWGPWTAFNRRDDPYWHSAVGSTTNYNGNTGVYTGKTKTENVQTKKGVQTISGENLQINLSQNYTLTKYDLKGRQGCCGNPNGRSPNSWMVVGWNGSTWNEVDLKENQGLNYEMRTYYITDPKPYNAYRIIITNCGNPGDRTGNRYCVQISQWNLYTSSDYNIQRSMTWDPSIIGYTDFDTCKKFAFQNGYKYFGMQDAKSDGTAACLVSNDLANSKRYGKAYKMTSIVLWETKTGDGKGSVALLDRQGSLAVNNSGGAAVWASPGANPSNYFGCYGDSGDRRLPTNLGSGKTYETCQTAAQSGKWKYFGLQYAQPNKTTECWVGNDFSRASSLGKANNCTTLSDGSMLGGGWSNAIYNTNEPTINSYLMLQDDGNMCIYRGTSPADNQGAIWCSKTNGKQKQQNSAFKAEKSKFGKNWIPNGTTLAAGDFIGSTNGSIYLLMQTDGNLVLCTTDNGDGCAANSAGKRVGGSWINALYEFASSGFSQNIGKLGFIDENDMLHEYPADNSQLTNTYTKFSKFDTYGNDISGTSYGNATKDQCQSTCDNNKDCYGYVYDFKNKVCYPKSSAMWPYGGPSRQLSTTDTYVRGKTPISVPSGATSETMNIDSAQYEYYNKGGPPDTTYGLANATDDEQAELARLELQMENQTNEINNLVNKYSTGTDTSENQADKNLQGLNDYQTDMENTNSQIDKLNATSESFINYGYRGNNNINKILQDSDIIVLQKNYEYLLWTILATGSVLVAMNISKN